MELPERIKNLMNVNKTVIKHKEGRTIEEQALNFFHKVYGYDDLKLLLFRGLISEEAKKFLLYGAPASAKSLIAKIIEENCNDVLFYDASNASAAGLIEELYHNQNAKVLIIDEFGMLKKNDLDALRGLLNDGRVVKTLKKVKYDFVMKNIKIFATTNDLDIQRAILSRFIVCEFPEYSDEDFIKVSQFCLQDKFMPDVSAMIANVLIANKLKDVRHVIDAAGLIQKTDTTDQIVSTIETMIKYKPTKRVDYN